MQKLRGSDWLDPEEAKELLRESTLSGASRPTKTSASVKDLAETLNISEAEVHEMLAVIRARKAAGGEDVWRRRRFWDSSAAISAAIAFILVAIGLGFLGYMRVRIKPTVPSAPFVNREIIVAPEAPDVPPTGMNAKDLKVRELTEKSNELARISMQKAIDELNQEIAKAKATPSPPSGR